jgi:TolB protein
MSRIAYIMPTGQLATVAPGGDIRVLTGPGTVFQFPAWSPDGKHLLTIGSAADRAGVYVLADEPAAPPLTLYENGDEPPIYCCWSPSGRHVAMVVYHPRGLRLLVGELSGGRLREVLQGQPCFFDWTPDGAQLLVHTGGGAGEPDLAFFGADSYRRSARLAEPGLFQAPGLAPSGRAWAYAEADTQHGSRLVVEREGGRRLALPHLGIVALGWCPTRDQLAFISPERPLRHCFGPLRLLSLSSDFARVLVDANVLAFFWAPTGRAIACLTVAGDRDLRPAQVGSSGNGVYTNGSTPPPRAQRRPVPARGLDLWVVDVLDGTQRHLATFTPPPLFVSQFLPFFDQYARSHQLWAPDGSALLVPSVDGGRPRLLLVPADAGRPEPVAEGIMGCWGPALPASPERSAPS